MVSGNANQPKRLHKLGLVLGLISGWAWTAVGAQGLVLDRPVALVEGHVITTAELDFEARVFLIRNGGVEAATRPLPPSSLWAALDALIGQRLLVAEAERLKAYDLEPFVLERELAVFKERLQTQTRFEAFLAQHQADEAALVAVLGRLVRAQRVLEAKFRLRAQVGEGEVRRYIAAHEGLKDEPLEAVQQLLVRERFVALTAAALQEQRKSAGVRLFGPWALRFSADAGNP